MYQNEKDKLATELAPEEITHSCTKKKTIKFTDYAISKYVPSFIGEDKKTRDRDIVSFDRSSGIKGLKLVCYRSSKRRVVMMRYWHDNKSKPYTFGEITVTFGIKQIRDQYNELVKDHQNNKGHWIKDPKQTQELNAKRITKAIVEDALELTVNEIVEKYLKANLPRYSRPGTLTTITQKTFTRFLIGYNKRHSHLKFEDDKRGYGRIDFVANIHLRTVAPTSWEDLFNKFPSGTGIDKSQKERSVYDSDIGKSLIKDLTTPMIKNYIEKNSQSVGQKTNLQKCLSALYNFALSNDYLTNRKTDINPTKFTIKKIDAPLDVEGNPIYENKNSKYNNSSFTRDELVMINDKAIEGRKLYPFQPEACLMIMATALREETVKKMRRQDVDYEKGIIKIPGGINKSRETTEVIITPPVLEVLNMINEQLEKPEFRLYKNVPWLFPTTRIDKKKIFIRSYTESDATRLKTLRGVWTYITSETGIVGAIRMFRKTYARMSKIELGQTGKAKLLTGHQQDSTFDVFYDKGTIDEKKEYANQVSNIYNFIKHKKTG